MKLQVHIMHKLKKKLLNCREIPELDFESVTRVANNLKSFIFNLSEKLATQK